jgi:hypothetical protein
LALHHRAPYVRTRGIFTTLLQPRDFHVSYFAVLIYILPLLTGNVIVSLGVV